VREHGLGGVMFWEYGNDPGGALLDALDGALRR
jgi:GH18 family chitinase